MTTPKLLWDEPAGCSTPRGWCAFAKRTHPDRKAHSFDYHADNGALNVGNYLDYSPPCTSRGPNGETVHAVAFVHRVNEIGIESNIRLGFCWFHTIEEAKAFIEGNVMAYFGLNRDGTPPAVSA